MTRRLAKRFWQAYLEPPPLSNPLTGDRCIEHAFVVKILEHLNKNKYKTVLDIGNFASPLTTIVKEMGFTVSGIDILPSSYIYDGVKNIHSDFLSTNFEESYDVIILCSTIEHIGLEGRFNSPKIEEGDILTIKKVKEIITSDGVLIITLPYGEEKTIKPLHRVYNKSSKLLQYTHNNFKVILEEFYRNTSQNVWTQCEENEARRVIPCENNYALGLFAFKTR